MSEEDGARRFGWWSFRTRIIAVLTVVSVIGLLAAGAVVYVVERGRILADVDERLEANLDSARVIVATGSGEAGEPWTSSRAALSAVMQRMSPDDNTGALGVVDAEPAFIPGIVMDVDLQDDGFAAEVARAAADGPVIGTFEDGGVQWRYLAVPIDVEAGEGTEQVVFAMAYDLAAELAEFDTPALIYLVAAGAVAVVIAASAGIVATRLLRPLRRMRQTAERVSAQSLSERLPIEGRDEVSDLATTMNDMLDRLDEALDSQRQLLSDVGHELKTPITIVRGYVEVMDADDPADVRETRALAVDELGRMGQLVQDLAGAAALHGASPIAVRPMDTGDLMAQIARKAEGIEGARVETGAFAEVTAELDPARITQAMVQLVQNAVTHGGGDIEIGSRLHDGALELWVRDHGPGVPDAEKSGIFDRFHRGSASGGSGLGLNIVQMIATAHSGRALVRDAPGGGAEFVIRLPHADAAASAPGDAPPPAGSPPSGDTLPLAESLPTLPLPSQAGADDADAQPTEPLASLPPAGPPVPPRPPLPPRPVLPPRPGPGEASDGDEGR